MESVATPKMLIFIPTYNEHENVERILEQINALNLTADILFLDDNSPDGTGDILDRLAEHSPHVHVIHRPGKQGIGSAHLTGIRWAYENDYQVLITMDCDFTHSPENIRDFIEYMEDNDVVIGSRYMEKGSLSDWNLFRKSLTYLGHFLTTKLLKMPFDATGAYRLYRLDRIARESFNLVCSGGYSFFYESLFVMYLNNYTIKEFPIKLPARTYGHSKMSLHDAMHSLLFLMHIFLRKLLNNESFLHGEQTVPEAGSVQDAGEWDRYWKVQKNTGGLIYDLIAVFYRKFIIRNSLNYFVEKYFQNNAEVLHAGCGSGQVDIDIKHMINITALDVSCLALHTYQKIHKNPYKLIHGTIFNIPANDKTYNGVYNLGVMEHFTEEEIQRILSEFHRVLKSRGTIILFWPPEFGLSVMFMKVVHYVLNTILKKNVRMHPDELTRIKSKKHVTRILEEANFNLINYYFGIKDLFTYVVIVAQKE